MQISELKNVKEEKLSSENKAFHLLITEAASKLVLFVYEDKIKLIMQSIKVISNFFKLKSEKKTCEKVRLLPSAAIVAWYTEVWM